MMHVHWVQYVHYECAYWYEYTPGGDIRQALWKIENQMNGIGVHVLPICFINVARKQFMFLLKHFTSLGVLLQFTL